MNVEGACRRSANLRSRQRRVLSAPAHLAADRQRRARHRGRTRPERWRCCVAAAATTWLSGRAAGSRARRSRTDRTHPSYPDGVSPFGVIGQIVGHGSGIDRRDCLRSRAPAMCWRVRDHRIVGRALAAIAGQDPGGCQLLLASSWDQPSCLSKPALNSQPSSVSAATVRIPSI